jgi:hypothetical protein
VFTDPGFIETEAVEMLDELEIAFEREGWIFVRAMKRRQECTEPHASSLLPVHRAGSSSTPPLPAEFILLLTNLR